MIKTLQLIETTGPGGAETVFLSLLAGLPKDQWPMTPILTGPGWLKTQVEALGYSPIEEETGGSFDLRFLRALRRRVEENAIDLVHAHMLGAAVYANLAVAGKGIPVVATFHGFPDLELPGVIGSLKRLILKNSTSTFVFVSEALREEAVQRGIVRENRAAVIHNGVDLSAFDAGNSKALTPRTESGRPAYLVGSIGNLRPAKDYGNLIRAAEILHRKSPGRFRFQVVGQRSEPLHAELLALRAGLGLDDSHVSFVGFRDDIPEIMSELDCLAISSSSEGFSLVAIQAMAAGVPVLSTRCGGPEGIIRDGEDGLLVPSEDPEALASGLERLLGDEGLKKRISLKGRETVEERFSGQAMISAYENVYRSALGRKPSPSFSSSG